MSLWDNLHYVKPCFSVMHVFPSHKHRLLMKMLQHCGAELQMWTERPLKEQNWGLLDSTTFPPQPELPPHKPASRKPAVGLRRREEVIFYIRAVNHSSMLCIFPMVVWLPGWLAERLAGRMRRNVLWSGPQCWGTEWETGTGGCWVITWPRGCLFKPKSCLDYCTQTLLLYCSCKRHKSRELEVGRRKKRGRQKEKESYRRRGRRGKGERRSG